MVASGLDSYHQEGAMKIVPPEALRAPSFEASGFRFPDLIDDQPEFETVAGPSYRFTPPYWSMARLDFDNDGDEDTVLINSFRSGSFDGDVVQITNDDEDYALADALRAYRETAETASLRPLMELLEEFTIVEYSGRFESTSPGYAERYTYQHIFRVNGETLVFAAPIFQRRRPTALIYRPRPNGEAEPGCIFQRIEENY